MECEKSTEVVDYYPTILTQEIKQTNTQNNLLNFNISCEKRACLMRSNKRKLNQNIIIIIITTTTTTIVIVIIIIIIIIIITVIIKRNKKRKRD